MAGPQFNPWRMSATILCLIHTASLYGGSCAAYSPGIKYVPLLRQRFHPSDLHKRDVVNYMLTPNNTLVLDYGLLNNPLAYMVSTAYTADTHDFVKLEDMDHLLEVSCQAKDNATLVSVKFDDKENFRIVENLWNRDDIVYSVHDPTCDGMDDRSVYRPSNRHFEVETLTFTFEATSLWLATNEVGHSLRYSSGMMPADMQSSFSVSFGDSWFSMNETLTFLMNLDDNAAQSILDSYSGLTKRGHFWHDVKEAIKNIWHNCTPFHHNRRRKRGLGKCLKAVEDILMMPFEKFVELAANHEASISIDVPMNESLQPLLGDPKIFGISCLNCRIHAGVTARSVVDLDISLIDAMKDVITGHPSRLLKDFVKEAHVDLEITKDIDIGLQLELDAAGTLSVWCNIMPFPITVECGWGGGVAGIVYQDDIKKWSAETPRPDNGLLDESAKSAMAKAKPGGTLNGRKFTSGKLESMPIDLRYGMYISASITDIINITSPGIDILVPAGQKFKLDLMSHDHVQNTIQPQVSLRKPQIHSVRGEAVISVAPFRASARLHLRFLHIDSLQLSLGAILDLPRFDFGFAEVAKSGMTAACPALVNQVDLAYAITVDIIVGIKFYFTTGKLSIYSSVSDKIQSALQKKWNVAHKCWPCNGHCPSQLFNKLSDAVVDLVWPDGSEKTPISLGPPEDRDPATADIDRGGKTDSFWPSPGWDPANNRTGVESMPDLDDDPQGPQGYQAMEPPRDTSIPVKIGDTGLTGHTEKPGNGSKWVFEDAKAGGRAVIEQQPNGTWVVVENYTPRPSATAPAT